MASAQAQGIAEDHGSRRILEHIPPQGQSIVYYDLVCIIICYKTKCDIIYKVKANIVFRGLACSTSRTLGILVGISAASFATMVAALTTLRKLLQSATCKGAGSRR